MTEGVRIRACQPEDAGAMNATLAALAEDLGVRTRFAVTEAAARHFRVRPGLFNPSDDRIMVLAGPDFATPAGSRKALA